MILEEPDDSAYIEVKSELPDSPKVSWSLSLPSSCSAKELYDTLSRQIHQIHSSFDLFLVKDCGEFKVDKDEEKVLKDFGLLSGPANRNVLKIVAQKAMATPSIVISSANKVDEKSEHDVKQDISSGDRHKQHTSTGYQRYVGLVNQAATCYLNSLLQALFMTPEFRNSLYKWEFVGSREEMSKSIPYQLQKLFVSLQTSSHIAVETSKLTRSFGWDASDSWQQHDIQELCRVMFDALEQRFKHTDQADFINNLYQGQLIDYVTCLECKTEKTRLDTFLDIPLPVRPFGSNVAYNSIADALLAFIQPETLNGNNQYFCETCNKKCDAHKGLKFSQFPYILTLHLKRFDFDYSVMSRIKLTDRVEFPHVLNMNGYLCENARMASNKALEENDQSPVINDSNITDTGEGEDEGFSLGEALHRPITGSNSSGSNVDIQDEDEDVELSKGLSKQHEKNYLCTEETDPKGPYVYELFSVMIHSGSASGGHYHVYIKDFENGKWFCFDDKSVSAITNDDISMTFGGGSYRGYYSSSTNAYMLMYRQIDKKRNQTAMKVNEFPPHLKELMKKMQEEEEKERILRERDKGCLKRKVYCNLPGESTIFEKRLVVDGETTLAEATAVAYRLFFLEGVVPLEQCRLVSYDSLNKHIDVSFEGKEEKPIRTIYSEIEDRFANDFYLEIRDKDVEFQRYQPEEFSFKIYHVNMKSEEVKCLREVRIRMNSTLDEMKSKISDTLQISSKIKLIVDDEDDEPHIIFDDVNALGRAKRIFVAEMSEHEAQTDFILEVTAVLEKYINSVTLYFILPDTDPESLAKLGITPVDGSVLTNGDLEKVHTSIFPSKSPSCSHAAQLSTLESEEECVGATGCSDQSTSEDSSLTDSDRTIVGDEADYCLAELSSASNSPPGSSVSSPEKKDQSLLSRMRENMTTPNGNKEDLSHNPQMTSDSTFCNNPSYPKHKITIQPCGSQESKNVICVKTDQRISLNTLEVALAQHLGVHPECVTIRRKCKGRDIEYKNMNSLHCLVGKDDLRVHLERCLKEGEFCGKVYLLIQDEDEPDEFLCYLNLADDMLVGEAKSQILEELRKRKDDLIPSYDRCRLRVKKWRTPGKILFDSQSLHDVGLSYNCELYLQELDEQENLTSPTDVTVMLRRFSNTNLPMGYFHEITLKSSSLNELRETLHAITSIPLQSLEFARGVFPLYKKRTRISKDLFNWKTDLNLTLEDGTVVFYRKKDKDINSNMQEGESCNLSIQQDESTFDPKGEDDNNDNMIDPQKTRHHYRSYKSKTSKARTVLDEMRAKPSGCKHYDGKALKIGVSLSGDSLKDPADLE